MRSEPGKVATVVVAVIGVREPSVPRLKFVSE